MYRIKAYFKNQVVVRYFVDQYEAIDFRDTVDAHYPLRVTFEKGVYPVRTFIINAWNAIMDDKRNPLSNIQDLQTRHVVMQLLAWMWCIICSLYLCCLFVFAA